MNPSQVLRRVRRLSQRKPIAALAFLLTLGVTDVKNTGTRDGDEVAELYPIPPHTNFSPALALDGFTRLHLAAGETRHVTFILDPRTLSQVDDQGTRAVPPGRYTIAVGGSQPGAAGPSQTATFTIEGSMALPR
jgi:beta-glucosidase